MLHHDSNLHMCVAPGNSVWLQSYEQSCENTLHTSITSWWAFPHQDKNGALVPPLNAALLLPASCLTTMGALVDCILLVVAKLLCWNEKGGTAAAVWIDPENIHGFVDVLAYLPYNPHYKN